MAPNSFMYSHLRMRRSTATSPVSPVDKPESSFHALDSPEAPSSPSPKSERPSTERPNQNSRFRVPFFAETSIDLSFDPSLAIPSRFSDEYKRHKPTSPPGRPRPSTSAAASREVDRSGQHFAAPPAFDPPQKDEQPDGRGGQTDHQATSPGESSPNPIRPSRMWREHSSSDNLSTPAHSPRTNEIAFCTGKEDPRNTSTSSLVTERVVTEDASVHKGSSSRFGKGRLNLLNPMSLLARRRVQNQTRPDEVVSTSNLTVPAMPDDYDPRIRGKIVHDFSAPRPRRILSYQGHSAENSPVNEPRLFEETGRRASDLPGLVDALAKRNAPLPQHSPIFKEHFNDDRQALQPGNKGYLHSFAASSALHGDSGAIDLPAFAKNLPLSLPNKEEAEVHDLSPSLRRSEETPAIPRPVVVSEAEAAIEVEVVPPIAHPSRPPPPPPPPPIPPIPPTSPLKDHKREYLPKHMASTSSRFSFQLGGVDSAAQERILEEKHKQQAALRKSVAGSEMDEDVEDDYEDFDPDADDGIEERIPGVNADSDEWDEEEATAGVNTDSDELNEEEAIPGVNADVNGLDEEAEANTNLGLAPSDQVTKPNTFHFTPASTVLSPTTTNATSQPTPRDEEGRVIGFANTTDSPNLGEPSQADQIDTHRDLSLATLNGLGISSIGSPGFGLGAVSALPIAHQSSSFCEDDLYFDDGNFDDFGADEKADSFDEAIFDDESGKIRDIPAQNARNLEAAQQCIPSRLRDIPAHDESISASDHMASSPTEVKQVSFVDLVKGAPHRQSMPDRGLPPLDTDQPVLSQRGGLTEGNLAAYHNALVSAANDAAANGRFTRPRTSSQASEDQRSSFQMHDDHPGLVSDDSRIALDHVGAQDEETFPFDDDFDDDLMIAEANAEVLENDDEGFYGQEFGFYARAHGKGNAEPVNGGFFGPRGADGIKRSHSAKANFQEPSLTPITERSEWSTRNSMASIKIPFGPYSNQSLPSPGIAQRLDLDSATFDDDDMTLNALMKLRRGAWGGSSTSVNSTGGSHSGNSPLTHLGSRDFSGSAGHLANGHNTVTASVHSLTDSVGIPESDEGEENEDHEVLTMIQNTPRKGSADAQNRPTSQDYAVVSPASVSSEKGKIHTRGHSRTSSGAESISYVKDPEGSGRWVLERRRTGDDGEFEIVGREYVAGARI